MPPSNSSLASDAIVPGVSPDIFNQSDFDTICRLVRDEAGIALTDQKRMLVYSRLAPLVRSGGMQSFAEYLNWIEDHPDARTKTVASLTTNHTYFNREPHHFDHFNANLRSDLIAQAERGEPVRIWSAACSSGEEIWTLMMHFAGADLGLGKRLAQRDVIALASDLADHVITAASKAVYSAEALEAMPKALRETWCSPVRDTGPETLQINDTLRKMVRFRRLNLLRPWPMRHLFDVIFCRNVMIYFDNPTKTQLVLELAKQLKPGGHLYIGHSERVNGEALKLLENVGPTVYRRRAT